MDQTFNLLIAARTHGNSTPRPSRIIQILQQDPRFHLTFSGLSPVDTLPFIPLEFKGVKRKIQLIQSLIALLFRRFDSVQLTGEALIPSLQTQKFDCIICHDLLLLPAIFKAYDQLSKPRPPILFDAREFYPALPYWKRLLKTYRMHLCHHHLPQVDYRVTVSQAFAKLYHEHFNLKQFDVLLSLPEFHALEPTPTGKTIKLIHHGIADKGRELDILIQAFIQANRSDLELHFMLVTKSRRRKDYLDYLKKCAQGNTQIHFHPPVLPQAMIPFINQFDVLVSTFPTNTNQLRYALPNKLFEGIQARLSLLGIEETSIGDFIKENKLGKLASAYNVSSLAKTLTELNIEEITEDKKTSSLCAERFSIKSNYAMVHGIVNQLLEKNR